KRKAGRDVLDTAPAPVGMAGCMDKAETLHGVAPVGCTASTHGGRKIGAKQPFAEIWFFRLTRGLVSGKSFLRQIRFSPVRPASRPATGGLCCFWVRDLLRKTRGGMRQPRRINEKCESFSNSCRARFSKCEFAGQYAALER